MQPRNGRASGADRQRCRRQRGHRAHLQRHDRSQLLDRSHAPATTTSSPCSTRHSKSATMTMEDFKQIPLHAKNNAEPNHAGKRCRRENDQHADRGRSLPALPRHRRVRVAQGRRPRRAGEAGARSHQRHQAAAEHARATARLGGVHAATRSRASPSDCRCRSCWST